MPGALFTFDRDGVIRSVNEAAKSLLCCSECELVGERLARLFGDEGGGLAFSELETAAKELRTLRREATLVSKAGERIPVFVSAALCAEEGGASTIAVCIAIDIRDRKRLEVELRQAQKLESVGRLAAGVAHEINTPIQFVSDSVHFLKDATNDLLEVVEKLQTVCRSVLAGAAPADAASAAAAAAEAEEAADLPYLLENAPKAFDRCLDGLNRVAAIVRSMKEFAHPDSKEMTTVDLNQAIESTLTIARTEYKYVADVETSFGDLPPVTCYPSEINQAILNIVVNAAHAIGDAVKGTDHKGLIAVRTRHDGEHVVVTIGDSGTGIPEHVRGHIFDPFFTTKEVGRGTGQGLAIARSVVVDKHKGELTFETEIGRGTTFTIRIPVAAGHAAAA